MLYILMNLKNATLIFDYINRIKNVFHCFSFKSIEQHMRNTMKMCKKKKNVHVHTKFFEHDFYVLTSTVEIYGSAGLRI